jgi:signal transduction histidine kinase
VIEADERKLKQIVYNLLSNAAKFTPDRGEVRLKARKGGNGYIEISVEDTGIGIKQEDLDRIFESFEQADGSITRKYPGTGLGLSLTKSLVELHGGKIWAESDGEGKGSAFTFTIPMQFNREDALRNQNRPVDHS